MQLAARIAEPTDAAEIALVRSVLSKLSFFRSERPEALRVERLGGLTNGIFRIECNGDSYVLRLPGEGTADYIDRAFERVALSESSRVKVSPEIVYHDAATGIFIADFVKGLPMSAALFRSNPGAPRRAGEVLKRLHASDAKFDFTFDLFGMIDEYLKVLADKPTQLPHGFTNMLALADDLRAALLRHPPRRTACHCDLLADNFIDTGSRMYLVDWEFSGMNDPMWDLGDACVECGFGPKEEKEFLLAYFGREPAPHELGRIVVYKAMCDLLWTLWGLIQHASGNPADDYRTYASRRFARAQTIVDAPSFAAHRAALMAV